jgi:hypothetical protein
VLTQHREPISGAEPSRLDATDTKCSATTHMNERAIELSEKSHVELVLYARGLEVERDRLLKVIRSAQQRLTAATETPALSPQQREALEQAASVLAKCL